METCGTDDFPLPRLFTRTLLVHLTKNLSTLIQFCCNIKRLGALRNSTPLWQIRLSLVPLGCSLIGMGYLKDYAFLEGRTHDLHANRET